MNDAAWNATVALLQHKVNSVPLVPETAPDRPVVAQWKVRFLRVLAPPGHPPCFHGRKDWAAYLEQATGATRQNHADGPLRFDARGVRINPDFDMCDDCLEGCRQSKLREGRCDPEFWPRAVGATSHAT